MKKFALLALLVLVICSGCVTMSASERKLWHEIKGLGLPMKSECYKSPTAAAFLSLLPGVSNFYLAAGSDDGYWSEGSPYGANLVVAALATFFYPFSIVWAIPQTILDACTINKMQTIRFYHYDPQGRAVLENARAATEALRRGPLEPGTTRSRIPPADH